MPALAILKERVQVTESAFTEVVIWRVPSALPGSTHQFKYRLAFVVDEICVLRYDNETGKGDHKHVNGREVPYRFTTPNQLVMDFWADVAQMRGNNERTHADD